MLVCGVHGRRLSLIMSLHVTRVAGVTLNLPSYDVMKTVILTRVYVGAMSHELNEIWPASHTAHDYASAFVISAYGKVGSLDNTSELCRVGCSRVCSPHITLRSELKSDLWTASFFLNPLCRILRFWPEKRKHYCIIWVFVIPVPSIYFGCGLKTTAFVCFLSFVFRMHVT
jgi:hypothetical protein